jgi:hypothetical protein
MRIATATLVAAGFAALPLSGARADCSFPLAWPFCIAGAAVGTAATIATAPLYVVGGPYYYGYPYYYGPPYYYGAGYYYYHHRRRYWRHY